MLIKLMVIMKPGNDDSVNFLESTPKLSPFQFEKETLLSEEGWFSYLEQGVAC